MDHDPRDEPGDVRRADRSGDRGGRKKKLIEYGLWLLDDARPSCETCHRLFWAKVLVPKHGDPPCHACTMPSLMPENETAWRVFGICSDQVVVVGMGTPLGIRFEAIETAISRAGVNEFESREVFFKVHELGLAYARMLRQKEEARQAAENPNRKTKLQVQPPPMLNAAELAKRRKEEEVEIERIVTDGNAVIDYGPPGGELEV